MQFLFLPAGGNVNLSLCGTAFFKISSIIGEISVSISTYAPSAGLISFVISAHLTFLYIPSSPIPPVLHQMPGPCFLHPAGQSPQLMTMSALPYLVADSHQTTAAYPCITCHTEQAAQQKGYRIPNDLSFIGINGILLSRYIRPALTTMHIDAEKMGTLAVEVLDDILNDRETALTHRIPVDRLIERETVADLTASASAL